MPMKTRKTVYPKKGYRKVKNEKKPIYKEMLEHPNIYSLLKCVNQEDTEIYVKEVLELFQIEYHIDDYGNIYNLDIENSPLLSSHMDTVMRETDKKLTKMVEPDETGIILSGGILGGDDKCGVYITLKLLSEGKKFNFVFSKDEEIGCKGIRYFLSKEENIKKIEKNVLYCLVLDRNGTNDIICFKNDYGTKEFEDALKDLSKSYGFEYVPALGVFSDADYISEHISTANLSVGYFNPHSSSEIIDVMSLEHAKKFVEVIIENLTKKFEPCEKAYSHYYGKGYGLYGQFEGYFDEYDDYKSIDSSKSNVCSCCNLTIEKEVSIEIYFLEGEKMYLCPDCAMDIQDQIRKGLAKVFLV